MQPRDYLQKEPLVPKQPKLALIASVLTLKVMPILLELTV
jgi:hypothetical protein